MRAGRPRSQGYGHRIHVKKPETIFACQNCGHQSRKWLGKCPECGEWNSLVEERERTRKKGRVAVDSNSATSTAVAYSEIESQDETRISSGVTEFDRVLGGGLVPGTLVLIGGDPGSEEHADAPSRRSPERQSGAVLYVSGEESERQIKLRGERLRIEAKNLFLLPETNLENIFHEVERLNPTAIVVDSIQTVFSAMIESAPGSVSQVREAAHQFLLLAKNRTIPVFLIGHITKDGSIAGPKALEHIVDTVLYFEGERHHNHRIVRAVKNRFGAANEIGVFEMTGAGLVPVANPSQMFLQERPQNVAGSVVTACMEGTRPLLVEIQALVSETKYGTGRRRWRHRDLGRDAGQHDAAAVPVGQPSPGARSRSSRRWSRPSRSSLELDAAITDSVVPLVFSTVSDEDIRDELQKTQCAFIDLFGSHLDTVERVLHVNATHGVGALHGVGDKGRYDARMKAIEFAMEHDDGQSLRNLEQADLILVAPSRCGKTPTSMYLALQHGLMVANYPLVDEDFDAGGIPRPIRGLADRCFGLLSTPARLSQVRGERRPGSTYASLAQCSYELRRAEALYRAHRIPAINSASMSVEEMAAVIMQTSLQLRQPSPAA